MDQLILPSSYENILRELEKKGDVQARMMEFVQPVEVAEGELAIINAELGEGGKVMLLFGAAGSGKSTFIESLSWRPHLEIAQPKHIDASAFPSSNLLSALIDRIREIATESPTSVSKTTCIVIDYLEDLADQTDASVKAFFRTLNGILRQNAILIVWPVTSRQDADEMLRHATAVSGTVFPRGKEIVDFTGPPRELFPTIASQTISVLNEGRSIDEFNLTAEDLDEILSGGGNPDSEPTTIREYLEEVYGRWKKTSGFIEQIHNRIPRQTEIWFVFPYPEAEATVSQFVRKTTRVESAWTALHAKLYEYIHNTQRAADWTPTRLQLALGGALTTRILFLPTNALIGVVAAYAPDVAKKAGIDIDALPTTWKSKSNVTDRLKNTPLLRQLGGEEPKMGMRRSGPAADALERAAQPYADLAAWTSGSGSGSDQAVNRALATALRDELGVTEELVVPEASHPWIPNVEPDIRIDTDRDRHICLELCYTNRTEAHVVADYVLKKLDRYMRQLESIIKGLGG